MYPVVPFTSSWNVYMPVLFYYDPEIKLLETETGYINLWKTFV